MFICVFFFLKRVYFCFFFFFFQAEDGIRDWSVTGVQTCALPISTPDGWTFWVNGREPTTGPCGYTAQEGDDVLWLVTRCEWDGSKCANEPVLPLELRAPAMAR